MRHYRSGGRAGEAIAERFSEKGTLVYITEMNHDAASLAACKIREKGNNAVAIQLDVSSESSWMEALRTVEDKEGRVDALVNNAGIVRRIPLTEMPVEDFDATMSVNARGPFLGMKHVIPIMQKNGGGAIVNISSIAGLIGHKYSNDAYIASKGAVTMLTKAVAVKYAKDRIRCNSVHPSTVDTPLVREMFKDPEKKAERIDEIPLGRLATAADVANAALFLASDEAAFITGAALPVDGGLTAC